MSKTLGSMAMALLAVVTCACSSTASKPPAPSPTLAVSPPAVVPTPTQIDLSAPSSQVVWVLVNGYLFRSTDRGVTWQQRTVPAPGGFPNPEISFVDDHDGWFATGGSPATQCQEESISVYQTTDAAATWKLAMTVDPNSPGARQCKDGLSFVDAAHGFLDGWDPNSPPTIYRTADGGLTWAASALPDPPGFVSAAGGFTLAAGRVKGFATTLLLAAGGEQPSTPSEKVYVLESVNGGASWRYLANLPSNPNRGFTFLSASHWLEIGNDGSGMETLDAGKTWHVFSCSYRSAASDISSFVFADPLVGYGTVDGVIEQTLDGGHSWTPIKTPGT